MFSSYLCKIFLYSCLISWLMHNTISIYTLYKVVDSLNIFLSYVHHLNYNHSWIYYCIQHYLCANLYMLQFSCVSSQVSESLNQIEFHHEKVSPPFSQFQDVLEMVSPFPPCMYSCQIQPMKSRVITHYDDIPANLQFFNKKLYR